MRVQDYIFFLVPIKVTTGNPTQSASGYAIESFSLILFA